MSRARVSRRPCRTLDPHAESAAKSALLKGVVAATAGLCVGAQLGCNERTKSEPSPATSVSAHPLSHAEASGSAQSAKGDRNCCMGMNECKGKGGCAVPESHACRGQNECRGKGGCNAHCPR